MFSLLLDNLYTAISAPFSFLETIFGSFGLSFLVIFICMAVSSFMVRNFVKIFFM